MPEDDDARNLFVQGQEQGKRIAHVGRGGGDYVQVTTFRYVGNGGGDFSMKAIEREADDDDGPFTPRCCCFCWLCIAILIAIIWALQAAALHHSSGADRSSDDGGESGIGQLKIPSDGSTRGGGISISMEPLSLDLRAVARSEEAEAALEEAVREALTFYIYGLQSSRVNVINNAEKGKVLANFIPDCGINIRDMHAAMNFTALSRLVSANLNMADEFKAWRPISIRIDNGESFRAPCTDKEAQDILVNPEATVKRPRLHHGWTNTSGHACEGLTIEHGVGPSADLVNGAYDLQEHRLEGKLVFRKHDDPDVWLAFLDGRWYVTDTERKRKESGGGWLYSVDVSGESPDEVKEWSEWNGRQWFANDALTMSCHKGENDNGEEDAG